MARAYASVVTSPADTKVVIVEYDPAWPHTFDVLATEIRRLLPDAARQVVHVGSTSVPGLAAKPVIDIALVVEDSSVEASYVDRLVAAGYWLRLREPEWFEHRLLKLDVPAVNLHVFSVGCDEVDRMVRFRDWLRTHPDDRELYESTKRELATKPWERVQDYADAKTDVVAEIMARALA